ncbi:uncharacterized protein BJX67DRAFT_352208 [Aspergillus lucknowensis]|uniref:Uncharacterized protein n=1 Tax=Aspergillus lucknowensis TaxID=176173 RepID=A0ABR4LTE9_9EURO
MSTEKIRIVVFGLSDAYTTGFIVQYLRGYWEDLNSVYQGCKELPDGKRHVTVDEKPCVVQLEEGSWSYSNPEAFRYMERIQDSDAYIMLYSPRWGNSLEKIEKSLLNLMSSGWGIREPSVEQAQAEAAARAAVTALRGEPEDDDVGLKNPRGFEASLSKGSSTWKRKRRERKAMGEFVRFPRLPVELKIAVLRTCLTSSRPIVGYLPHTAGINFNVLRVCRLFHREGTKIFWAENRFVPWKSICLVADYTYTPLWDVCVSPSEGRALARRLGARFEMSSSKETSDVERVVAAVVRECRARKEASVEYARALDRGEIPAKRNHRIRLLVRTLWWRITHFI